MDRRTVWREVAIMRQCLHPHVVPLYGVVLQVGEGLNAWAGWGRSMREQHPMICAVVAPGPEARKAAAHYHELAVGITLPPLPSLGCRAPCCCWR